MRKVVVRQSDQTSEPEVEDRLISLLATGLERLFKRKADAANDVDFGGRQSVTTDCPDAKGEEAVH